MNAKTLALCILFLTFGFIAKAEDSYQAKTEIPGGIVYSDGKDVIYYDFKTKEKTNLTADLKEAKIQDLFAISEDGQLLIWVQNSNLWQRKLLNGKPHVLKTEIYKEKKTSSNSGRLVSIGEESLTMPNLRNLTLSPKAMQISYEFEEKGESWTQVPPGSQLDREWLRKGPDLNSRLPYRNSPMYIRGIDSFNAIALLNPTSSFYLPPGKIQHCGNVASFPPIYPFRIAYENFDSTPGATRIPVGTSPGSTPNIAQFLTLTVEDTIQRFSIKRNAFFGSWAKSPLLEDKEEEMFALIYQTPYGWGPIEIRSSKHLVPIEFTRGNKKDYYEREKPGVYEIPLQLKSCEGLTWKPDGSIAYLSEGKVFSINGDKIKQGIRSSGIAKNPDPSYSKDRGTIPIKYVFPIEPTLIADAISARRHYWVSNDAFIFRGRDNTLRLWNQGESKTLLATVPEMFFYCNSTPLNTASDFNPIAKNPVPTVISGKDRAREAFLGIHANNGRPVGFNIGSIETSWTGKNSYSIAIWIKKNAKDKKGLEFALPEESDLNKIKDPSQYEYQTQYEWRGPNIGVFPTKTTFTPKEKVISKLDVQVPLNEVIILKSGNTYAAIKPIAIEPKFKSSSDVPEWMTYEWKFWSSVPEATVKIKTKTFEESLISKGWETTEVPISKEFEIGGIKFTWQPVKKKQSLPKTMKVGKTYYPAEKFLLTFQITDRTSDIGYLNIDIYIQDPSRYSFFKSNNLGGHGWLEGNNSVLILKIGNRYIAIKPLKNKGDSITYQWKYWPEVPPVELAKTALNK